MEPTSCRLDRLFSAAAQESGAGVIVEALDVFEVLAQHVEGFVARLRAAEVKKPLRRLWPG